MHGFMEHVTVYGAPKEAREAHSSTKEGGAFSQE